MAEYNMLPLWTDALLGDTQHLDATEFGAYMLMLIVAWRSADCALPTDDKYLAGITRVSPHVWKKIKPTVMAFWSLGEDGRLRQKRQIFEREKAQKFRERQSSAGKASVLKRKETDPTTVEPPFQPRPQPKANQTSTTVSVSVSKKESTPPSSLDAARGDGDGLLKSADELRDRLEAMLNLATPVIRAPIVSWLQAGATVALIEATIADVLARKPGWKPDGIGYFGKAVMRAIEAARADGATNGHAGTELTDLEAKRIAMKAKAEQIAKGQYMPTVEIDDVRGMIHLGWITAEQARAVGYRL